MTTVLLITALCGLLAVSLVLQAMFLQWGLRWAKVSKIAFTRAMLLILAFFAVSVFITVGFSAFTPDSPQEEFAIGFGELAAQFLIPCVILARLYRVRLLRAFQAWLPILIPAAAMLALTYFVYRPLVFEAFVAPTNSMAPTILGHHSIGECPRCGQPAYGFWPSSPDQIPPDGLELMCSRELRACRVTNISETAGQPDRFLVGKFLSPRRWDVIVFRLPSDPAVHYVKRLVGLPGEQLLLRDGAVWIDGKKLEPHETLRGIEYLSALEWNGTTRSGAGSSPVTLGPDEYFVLGDFSAQASDSRFWEQGAPGHQRFAVPKSHIVGVVTHIYWPFNRWRILR